MITEIEQSAIVNGKSSIKILIVEDENIIARDIKKCLEKFGYIVTAIAASGERAIKKAGENKPDLALMDIVIKGEMDGIEVADIIRSLFDIPVVYFTAYSDEELLERAKITEPFGYLIKPFQERELHSVIKMALYKDQCEKERKKLTQELHQALIDIKALSGMLPICSFCKKIRDDKGNWNQIESFISDHSEAEFSHSVCPSCKKKHYPEFYK